MDNDDASSVGPSQRVASLRTRAVLNEMARIYTEEQNANMERAASLKHPGVCPLSCWLLPALQQCQIDDFMQQYSLDQLNPRRPNPQPRST